MKQHPVACAGRTLHGCLCVCVVWRSAAATTRRGQAGHGERGKARGCRHDLPADFTAGEGRSVDVDVEQFVEQVGYCEAVKVPLLMIGLACAPR